jgi:N-acetylneuraminate synthase
MSTGMQTVDSMRPAVAALDASGVDYALLECTNLYPSPPEIVSLQGITELRQAFPRAVIGFSDHSIGPSMAISAVALGACILERHFTDTRYRKGPDISCSMDPAELRFIIDRSKEIHTALHNPKVRTAPEEDVYRFARGSIVADRDLPAGHLITEQDIWARRPGSGEIRYCCSGSIPAMPVTLKARRWPLPSSVSIMNAAPSRKKREVTP